MSDDILQNILDRIDNQDFKSGNNAKLVYKILAVWADALGRIGDGEIFPREVAVQAVMKAEELEREWQETRL